MNKKTPSHPRLDDSKTNNKYLHIKNVFCTHNYTSQFSVLTITPHSFLCSQLHLTVFCTHNYTSQFSALTTTPHSFLYSQLPGDASHALSLTNRSPASPLQGGDANDLLRACDDQQNRRIRIIRIISRRGKIRIWWAIARSHTTHRACDVGFITLRAVGSDDAGKVRQGMVAHHFTSVAPALASDAATHVTGGHAWMCRANGQAVEAPCNACCRLRTSLFHGGEANHRVNHAVWGV